MIHEIRTIPNMAPMQHPTQPRGSPMTSSPAIDVIRLFCKYSCCKRLFSESQLNKIQYTSISEGFQRHVLIGRAACPLPPSKKHQETVPVLQAQKLSEHARTAASQCLKFWMPERLAIRLSYAYLCTHRAQAKKGCPCTPPSLAILGKSGTPNLRVSQHVPIKKIKILFSNLIWFQVVSDTAECSTQKMREHRT